MNFRPNSVALFKNYSISLNPTTRIKFGKAENMKSIIAVYESIGKKITEDFNAGLF